MRGCFPASDDVAAGALFDGQRLLVARRGPDEAAPGQWELPGGKVESGESLEQAVVREWKRSQHGGRCRAFSWFVVGRSSMAEVQINVVEVHPTSALPKVMVSQAHDDIRWFGPDDDVDAFTWLGPDRDVVLTLVPWPRSTLKPRHGLAILSHGTVVAKLLGTWLRPA